MGERRRESGKEGDRKNSREKIKNHIDMIYIIVIALLIFEKNRCIEGYPNRMS